MDDQTKKHSASFAPPVFKSKSRVARARMLAEASGLKFDWVFDEEKQEFVLSDPEVKRLWKHLRERVHDCDYVRCFRAA